MLDYLAVVALTEVIFFSFFFIVVLVYELLLLLLLVLLVLLLLLMLCLLILIMVRILNVFLVDATAFLAFTDFSDLWILLLLRRFLPLFLFRLSLLLLWHLNFLIILLRSILHQSHLLELFFTYLVSENLEHSGWISSIWIQLLVRFVFLIKKWWLLSVTEQQVRGTGTFLSHEFHSGIDFSLSQLFFLFFFLLIQVSLLF